MADAHEPKNDLIVSLHIPKTAGTYFGSILKSTHGEACALYYGAGSERTHPILRGCRPLDITADHLNRLAESGVKVLHGHLRARYLAGVLPDPRNYYVILREPIEQTISHYYYQLAASPESRIAKIIQTEGLPLERFTSIAEIKNYQSSFIKPFALEDFGFVGVTELMRDMLPLLGLKDRGRKSNVNPDKPLAGLTARQALAADLTVDLGLYSQALEMALRQLGTRRDGRGEQMRRRLIGLARRTGLAGR